MDFGGERGLFENYACGHRILLLACVVGRSIEARSDALSFRDTIRFTISTLIPHLGSLMRFLRR